MWRRTRRPKAEPLQISIQETVPTIYWRPGCGFCTSLFRSLDRLGVQYDRANIWDDPSAAAFVRSATGGNETVPTVSIGKKTLVNPQPREVLVALTV